MTTMTTKVLLAAAALTGTALVTLPAAAMPMHQEHGASTMLQLSSWADRVRGRTSSSTGEVGYGYYGYGRGYPGYYPYGYQRPPYVYNQPQIDYDDGYGYDAY